MKEENVVEEYMKVKVTESERYFIVVEKEHHSVREFQGLICLSF
jgi:hypothetical protein